MTPRLLTVRSGLLVAVLLFLHPLHLSAQSSIGSTQLNRALSREAEYQVESLDWATPVRFKSGAPREIGTPPLILTAVRSSEGVTVPTRRLPSTLAAGWLERAASRELARLNLAAPSTDSALLPVQQPGQRKRSWIARHPVLSGTLVGLGGGYLVGVGAGEDGIFDDFTAGENGLFVAGIGAGTGALVGAIVGAATK